MTDEKLLQAIVDLAAQIARAAAEPQYTPFWENRWAFALLYDEARERGLIK